MSGVVLKYLFCFLPMKKFLLLSHYAPKPGFKYPEHDCPLAHRETAHNRIYAFEKFWSEGVIWQTVEVEKASPEKLIAVVKEPWDAVWLSGSPYLLKEASDFPWITNAVTVTKILLEENKNPVIGLCFGLQLLAKATGGKVVATNQYITGESDILNDSGQKIVRTKAYHENYVKDLPDQAKILGYTEKRFPYLVKFSEKVLGVQSHPECALKSECDMRQADEFWKKQFKSIID